MFSKNSFSGRSDKAAIAASALGAGMIMLSSSANAQLRCDLNGVAGVPIASQGADSLVCGNPAGSFGVSDNLTAIGDGFGYNGDNITLIGTNAFAATSAGFNFDTFLPPAGTGTTVIGSFAAAAGPSNVAIGDQALVGDFTFSGGGIIIDNIVSFGTAVGSSARVVFDLGTAVGAGAYSDHGTAIGYNARATAPGGGPGNDFAVAIGNSALADNLGAVSIGAASNFFDGAGAYAVGIGASSTSSGDRSIAIGGAGSGGSAATEATASDSIAIGSGAKSTHANSIALGTGTETTAENQVHVGGRTISGVAAGVAATDAVNVSQLQAVTGDVSAVQTTVASHTTQITALQAADMAFDVRMDAMELLAEGLDERIDKVDDRASAGTAAAVALSGAMFLPGKSFNLTGNIGTYRGAHAAAVQFGALVSDRVALNAGIAHGFNKGGKTALRAGFTIGW